MLMHLKHHSEAPYVKTVLEAAESWFLLGAAVLDQPHRAGLELVEEGKVFIGSAAPGKAGVLKRRADLRLVKDLQPFVVKEP